MTGADIADLRLGLCGWNGSQGAYFADFDCIEIQSTFYDLPSPQVARKWRSAAPPDFQFCIKAWQLITHSAASPTYRRLRSPLPANDREAVGSFRQTEQVWQAWLRTLDVALAVDARVILFQCPKSFLPTSENLINFSAFFRRVSRDRFHLAFEPRGETWTEDVVQDLCGTICFIALIHSSRHRFMATLGIGACTGVARTPTATRMRTLPPSGNCLSNDRSPGI
jgi:uncharacterized protein YecE (DUF72 family)